MSDTTHPDTPPEALQLAEAVTVARPEGQSALNADGTVNLHIIRPGIGRGRGKHLYEADMLAANASKFAGWKMYVDHRSPEAKKAAGGLPRSVRDLGGRVLEASWDPTVPADPERGFGAGAVVGKVRPLRMVRELIEDDPEIIEASISATATGVRPVQRDGQKVWLVEGINPRGSVDWVTEAGAGGRVVPVMEAAYADEHDVEMALLESMTDEELVAHLREYRPGLSLDESETPDETAEPDPDAGDAGDGEREDPDPDPEPAEEPDDGDAATGDDPDPAAEEAASLPEEDDVTITPEALLEALHTDEGRDAIRGLVESAIDREREHIRAEARADAQREIELTRLEAAAHRQIAESNLPAGWREDVVGRYSLVEGAPTVGLDVYDEVDEYGTVTRTAAVQLREAIQDEIAHQRRLLAEANPTRVRGQGRARAGEDEPAVRKAKETGWGRFLMEAGVDPDTAYDGPSLETAGESA